MKIAFLVLAVLLTTLGCRSTRSADAEPGDAQAFTTLLRGYHSGILQPGLHVARNAAEWDALWRSHATSIVPRPDAPAVDWDHQMVVCVALGSRSSGGYAVEVVALERADDTLRVTARETRPDGKIVPMVVTQPYHMLTTEPFAGAVELVLE